MSSTTTFALITEGITDQVVIQNILRGFFNDPDIDPNPLQPIVNYTDNRQLTQGGWRYVIEYCKSQQFKSALDFNDYVIVQIDTDVSDEKGFDVSKFENGIELAPNQLRAKVVEKFISFIGEDFFVKYQNRIIFAICVHSMECWLLPIYCDKKSASKIKGCLDALNRCLTKRNEKPISQDKKDPKEYDISKSYLKHKRLMELYKLNPSLEIFIDELILRFPQTETF
ncbi:MAG: hypothetical protein FD167_4192 [bacterium]|nr:MAG: hypothetical protein FD167_4192 [bacterium]